LRDDFLKRQKQEEWFVSFVFRVDSPHPLIQARPSKLLKRQLQNPYPDEKGFMAGALRWLRAWRRWQPGTPRCFQQ
jgi:hypothetical protein